MREISLKWWKTNVNIIKENHEKVIIISKKNRRLKLIS